MFLSRQHIASIYQPGTADAVADVSLATPGRRGLTPGGAGKHVSASSDGAASTLSRGSDRPGPPLPPTRCPVSRPPRPGVPLSPDRKATPSRGGAKKAPTGTKKSPSGAPPSRRATAPSGTRGGATRGGGGAGSRAAKPGSRTPSGKPRRSLGRRLVKWVLLAGLAFFLLGCAAFAVGYATTDVPDPNKDFQAQTTFVYYSDGKHEIGRFANQNRTSVALSDVPQHVQDAVIAAEDRTFETNKGIDPKGILRAAFSNARGGSTQGASTITQQYVKVLYLSQERTLTRKVKEAFVSLKIQRQESKDEILQGYLNTIYFGRGAYGIQAAAQAYFGKDAKDLTVQEGAVLASVLNSPTAFDPANGADARARLLGRYQYVLDGMASMGNLDADRAERVKQRLPKFPRIKSEDQYGGQRGHVLTLVKRELLAKGFTDQEISGGGLKVTTTFTRNAMDAAAAGGPRAEAEGSQGPARRGRLGRPADRRAQGLLRRPGLPQEPDQLRDPRRRLARARPSSRSRWPPASRTAIALNSTFDGNSPYVFPNGKDKVVNEGPGDGNDYGSRDLADQGHRGVGEHRVRRPHRVDGQRPAEDPGHGREDGRPAPRARPRARRRHLAGLGHDQPDRHGQRLRHHRRRRQGQEVVRHQQGDRPPAARRSYKAPKQTKRVLSEDIDQRRQLRAAAGGQERHRPERPGARPPGRPARPAPRPTPTATSPRPGSSATPRSWRPP